MFPLRPQNSVRSVVKVLSFALWVKRKGQRQTTAKEKTQVIVMGFFVQIICPSKSRALLVCEYALLFLFLLSKYPYRHIQVAEKFSRSYRIDLRILIYGRFLISLFNT